MVGFPFPPLEFKPKIIHGGAIKATDFAATIRTGQAKTKSQFLENPSHWIIVALLINLDPLGQLSFYWHRVL